MNIEINLYNVCLNIEISASDLVCIGEYPLYL